MAENKPYTFDHLLQLFGATEVNYSLTGEEVPYLLPKFNCSFTKQAPVLVKLAH